MASSLIQKLSTGTPLKIVCFGDSITGLYYHTGGRRAWTEAFGQTLQELYPQARLKMINAGISGNTSAHGVERMEADVLAHQPDLIVVMFGMNDAAHLEAKDLRTNLQQIIDRAHEHRAEVILMTPNAIADDDPSRTVERLAEYAEVVRDVARQNGLILADAYQVFEDIRQNNPPEWIRLMSDAVHPNMRGHRLFAAILGEAISGRKIAPPVLPVQHPRLPHLKTLLESDHPIRITAMKPADTLIRNAILTLYPEAKLEIQTWDPAGKSISEIEIEAKEKGWWHYRENPELLKPDFTIVAVPSTAFASLDRKTYLSFGWVLNWSQSFDHDPRADCLPILPSVWEETTSASNRAAEQFALDVILNIDLPVIQRRSDDTRPAAELIQSALQDMLSG